MWRVRMHWPIRMRSDIAIVTNYFMAFITLKLFFKKKRLKVCELKKIYTIERLIMNHIWFIMFVSWILDIIRKVHFRTCIFLLLLSGITMFTRVVFWHNYPRFYLNTEGEYLCHLCHRSKHLLHGDRVVLRHEAARHVADGDLHRHRPATQVPALDRQPGAALHRTLQGEDLPKRQEKEKPALKTQSWASINHCT